jgi:hypothetical protein
MRILATAGGAVRHGLGAVAEAGLVAAIAITLVFGVAVVARNDPAGAAAVYAAKGGNGNAGANGGGGGPSASIALIEPARLTAEGSWPMVGNSVSFAVSANVKERDLYSLWVANECFQDGVKIYAEYQPARDGVSGPFTLDWTNGAASCTASVWRFPDIGDVLAGGTTSYTVN